ncbi:MAG: quinol:cytochrome C oxidoreductase [Planctomycetes bacterium]|nr:quinol:cytochrome C oxidoreductase [Planctomycetota bacterium]MBL7008629.1 quinol:cytochrome C oxidoreductase [Planctomycetota bacterium]
MTPQASRLLAHDNLHDAGLSRRFGNRFLLIGLAALAVGLGLGIADGDELRHFFHAYLVGYAFVLSVALGGMFFVLIQHLTNAHWSVTVRRLAEFTIVSLPWVGVLGLPLLYPLFTDAGLEEHGGLLWPWIQPLGEDAALVTKKVGWLNPGFFAVRMLGYFAVWGFMGTYFVRKSLQQDLTDSYEPTLKAKKWSALGMIVFALSLTAAAFDLLMSLDPAWFSTIFGVYFFSGSLIAIFSWLILTALFMQRTGRLQHAITVDHYHDLGKFLFAFVFFWGYIAFSQYMLIWYANIPEETLWFAHRQTEAWMPVSWLLVVGHFIIPFAALLSRHTKRRVMVLGFWAAYMLVMHWVDLYWLVMPALDSQALHFGLCDVATSVGIVGLYVAGLCRIAGDRPLIPVNDPLLAECLAFKNV